MSVKLLALAASTRPDSLNKQLLTLATHLAVEAGASVTTLDYADLATPLYMADTRILPPTIERLSDALRSHDGLLLATPEFNWSIPGALKNLIDWLSVDARAPLNGITALLMCASPSSRGGISGLQHTRVPLEVLGSWVYPQMIGIGNASAQLTPGRLTRDKDQAHLQFCVTDFVRRTNALRNHDAR